MLENLVESPITPQFSKISNDITNESIFYP